MNINLSKAAGKVQKKKGGLAMGLNARGNVFGAGADEESSSDEEKETPATGREAVNRAIAKEQAALRERAAAAAAGMDADQLGIYDYDGAYDSFQKKNDSSKTGKDGGDSKKSRYIGDLLQAAEKRQRERDIVHERKVAREQAAEEEAEPEFRGKEKFVTASYKRKLEERKVWQEQDEKQRKLEEENDVTKQSDGVASFYGNLNRNVAMGGGVAKKQNDEVDSAVSKTAGLGVLDGFAKADDSNVGKDQKGGEKNEPKTGGSSKQQAGIDDTETVEDTETRRKRMRLLREKKVEEARARYFERLAAKASQAGTVHQ